MSAHFDIAASEYDTHFSNTHIGGLQRNRVHRYLDKYFVSKNLNILEINCGTGEDAIFLSKHHQVVATDASSVMIKITKDKIVENNLQEKCNAFIWDLNNPYPGEKSDKFDLIFSNFGGLNCLAPNALEFLIQNFTSLLNPKGKLLFVVMGRKCVWESMYFLLKGQLKSAFRRRKKQSQKAQISNNTFMDIWYYSPKEIEDKISFNFKIIRKKPVGIFIPPSYLENYFKNKSRFLPFLNKMETRFGNHASLSNYADHYIIELEKQ